MSLKKQKINEGLETQRRKTAEKELTFENLAEFGKMWGDACVSALGAEKLLEKSSLEERLRGVSVEERLKGLTPEERLRGVSVEERLKGLTPEERLRGLSVKEIENYLRKIKKQQ